MERLRKENLILWVMIMFMAIGLLSLVGPGCATTGVGTAYNAVYSSLVTYDTVLKIAADQYEQGNISEEQKEKIIEQAEKVYDAIGVSQKALKVYKLAETIGDKEGLSKAEKALYIIIDAMEEARDALLSMIDD
jgi:hypothetical protein